MQSTNSKYKATVKYCLRPYGCSDVLLKFNKYTPSESSSYAFSFKSYREKNIMTGDNFDSGFSPYDTAYCYLST